MNLLFPFLCGLGAGILSGFITAFIQTKMGVDSLLAGIIVNTALYSVNIAIMSGSVCMSSKNFARRAGRFSQSSAKVAEKKMAAPVLQPVEE